MMCVIYSMVVLLSANACERPVSGAYGPSLKLLQHVTMFDRQLYVSASAGMSYLYHFAYVLLHYK